MPSLSTSSSCLGRWTSVGSPLLIWEWSCPILQNPLQYLQPRRKKQDRCTECRIVIEERVTIQWFSALVELSVGILRCHPSRPTHTTYHARAYKVQIRAFRVHSVEIERRRDWSVLGFDYAVSSSCASLNTPPISSRKHQPVACAEFNTT